MIISDYLKILTIRVDNHHGSHALCIIRIENKGNALYLRSMYLNLNFDYLNTIVYMK